MSQSIKIMAEEVVSKPLRMNVIARCSTTKARVGKVELPHSTVDTPVFMPVGTQGTIKGITPRQLEDCDVRIILGNTYHLGNKPGSSTLAEAGGLHKFMSWPRSLLTDSGGFQMVSLSKLAEFSEEGVKFIHPKDGSEMLLTPEKSIEIQNSIGADIMMQLDDVISSQATSAERFKLATHRSVRWLDRCIKAHKKPEQQNLFPIIQGGLDENLRKICLKEMTSRDVNGFAIGGLSGGESKHDFWKMVTVSTEGLPEDKPRYLMGVGYAIDLIVCSALGCDMFDCVFPTRTARFGSALIPTGQIQLKQSKFGSDYNPIDSNCKCSTCRNYTRAYIHILFRNNTASACSMVTIHNIYYQANLMNEIRTAIKNDDFPNYIKSAFSKFYPSPTEYPEWASEALLSVGVKIK